MKLTRLLPPLTLGFGVLISGCDRERHMPSYLIVMLDMSASIEPTARKELFTALEEVPLHLKRGDTLVIIPITGDAQNQAQGRILRFKLSEIRAAYDQDIREVGNRVRKALEEMQSASLAEPGDHTDLLGTFQLASEEIRLNSRDKNPVVIVFSDFLQDDSQFNFTKSPSLKNEVAPQHFAIQLARESPLTLPVQVYLGSLRSKELSSLSHERRVGIKVFWEQYLSAAGARTQIATDGPGLLATITHE